MIPYVNGRVYDWAMVVARATNATIPFVTITAVTYKDTREIEKAYGAGSFAHGRGFGNYNPEASITLTMDEVEKLQQSVPSGRLQDVPPFDLVVSFLHPDLARVVTHTIHNCKYTENSRELTQNAKKFEVTLPLDVSHISWNANGVLGLVKTEG